MASRQLLTRLNPATLRIESAGKDLVDLGSPSPDDHVKITRPSVARVF